MIFYQTTATMNSTTQISKRRERFERVSATRVGKIKALLEQLQNCANRNNYEYTQEDVEAIFHDLSQALKETKKAFK